MYSLCMYRCVAYMQAHMDMPTSKQCPAGLRNEYQGMNNAMQQPICILLGTNSYGN